MEDGHLKYEVSDDEIQLQAGDLGPMANPYRQVKYLVIQMARYSNYAMTELRLHAIGLYAGLTTTVPEPVGSNGTPNTIDDTDDSPINSIDYILKLLAVGLSGIWELVNYWPTLFISVVQTLETIYDILLSIDLCGDIKVH